MYIHCLIQKTIFNFTERNAENNASCKVEIRSLNSTPGSLNTCSRVCITAGPMRLQSQVFYMYELPLYIYKIATWWRLPFTCACPFSLLDHQSNLCPTHMRFDSLLQLDLFNPLHSTQPPGEYCHIWWEFGAGRTSKNWIVLKNKTNHNIPFVFYVILSSNLLILYVKMEKLTVQLYYFFPKLL